MLRYFFRAVVAHLARHHAAATSPHMGPVHAWLNHTVGASQGAGTAIIAVVFLLIIAGAVIGGLRKIFA